MVGTTTGTPQTRPHGPQDESPMVPPLWREALWPLDWLALRLSPIYCGIGVPRGDGAPVILVPGFMGTDLYLTELYLWLCRIGYRPYMSGIGINADCPDHMTVRLVRTLERVRDESGKPARLIGHSFGGIIGRAASVQRPDLVAQIIYLGTPIRAQEAHPVIMAAVAVVRMAVQFRAGDGDGRCLTGRCDCAFNRSLARLLPASVRRAALYSREDGVVNWKDCRVDNPRLNYDVGGTHLGLVFNPRAYCVLGQLLANPGDGG